MALVRPRPDFYALFHPRPGDVLLVIEVADTLVEHDRQVKVPLYARYGIPEVWLLDLEGGRVEGHRDPHRERYRMMETLVRGEKISPQGLPDLELEVDEILGPS